MNFSNLDSIRNSLFTAIEDAKLAVNTDQFSSKVEIVSNEGLRFALESGALSKDERLQIEDLFSTTVLNKQQIINMMLCIFKVDTSEFNFGPGSRELIGGGTVNGYFGEVSAEELFTGEELGNLLNITQGSVQHSDTNWLKFYRYGNIIYIPKLPIRNSASWNTFNGNNVVYGDNPELFVEKNNNKFIPRLMTGGSTDPVPNISKGQNRPINGMNSEWTELIYNVHVSNANQLEVPWESFSNIDLGVSGGLGSYTLCQETTMDNTGVLSRGEIGVYYYTSNLKNTAHNRMGWRPVLALLQSDGSYSTGREHHPN